MSFSEAMLHIYATLVFCVVVFLTVVIVTVRVVGKAGEDGNKDAEFL